MVGPGLAAPPRPTPPPRSIKLPNGGYLTGCFSFACFPLLIYLFVVTEIGNKGLRRGDVLHYAISILLADVLNSTGSVAPAAANAGRTARIDDAITCLISGFVQARQSARREASDRSPRTGLYAGTIFPGD